MALNKQITLENGITTQYHRIKQIYLDKRGNIDILVNSYASQTYRNKEIDENDYSQVVISNFYHTCINKPSINYEEAYNLLKEFDIFTDADDI